MNQLSGILGFAWSILPIPTRGYYFRNFRISLPIRASSRVIKQTIERNI